MSIPRTTHQWIQPLYNVLDGHGQRPLQLGSPTSIMGFYGASGATQAVGVGASGGVTGGASGAALFVSSGGSGAQFYSFSDLVLALKKLGLIKT